MDFDQLNETDVREEIVAPLLRQLGYRSASEHNVVREQSLRYPRVFLGRKNLNKDPLLRGKADYILEAGRRVRWVIEAKSPSCSLDEDEIAQAWTYANHPEVRAIYFCLCNGRRLDVYQTNGGPEVPPILSLGFEELQGKAGRARVAQLLSPESVLRDYPSKEVYGSPPLGPGLRSIARISGGFISYGKNSMGLSAMSHLQATVVGGAIERDEVGRMVALIETRAPLRAVQVLLEKLGLTQFEMACSDGTLSTCDDAPNVFTFLGEAVFPAGEQMLDIASWQTVEIPEDIRVAVHLTAWSVLQGNLLHGRIENKAIFNDAIPGSFEGEFELYLS